MASLFQKIPFLKVKIHKLELNYKPTMQLYKLK